MSTNNSLIADFVESCIAVMYSKLFLSTIVSFNSLRQFSIENHSSLALHTAKVLNIGFASDFGTTKIGNVLDFVEISVETR